jgi:hypothetical protein
MPTIGYRSPEHSVVDSIVLMPIQIRILPQVLHMLVNKNILLLLIHSSASLHGLILSFLYASQVSKFSIFWTVYRIEFFWRKKSIV